MFLHLHVEDLKKYYKRLFGILAALVSYFFFALANVLTRFATSMQNHEVMFVRQITIFVLVILYFALNKELAVVTKTSRLPTHCLRGFFGYLSSYVTVLTMSLIPIAETSALTNTHGIFMLLLTPLLLNDKVSARAAFYLVIGFIGVVIIANPVSSTFNTWGYFWGLMAGFTQALSVLYIKVLAVRGEQTKTCIFWFAFISGILSVIPLFFNTSFKWLPQDVLLSILIGFFAMLGQVFLTISIFNISPPTAAIVRYSSMIWNVILGYIFWGEIPNAAFYIGSVLIIYSGFASTTSKLKASKTKR